jgi:hypothetical protein
MGDQLVQEIETVYTTLAHARHGQEAKVMLAKIVKPGQVFFTQFRYSSTALSADKELIKQAEQISEPEKWSLSLLAAL